MEFVTARFGAQMQHLIYETALKKERTEGLVLSAFRAGFPGS